jgi:hypothetical protein
LFSLAFLAVVGLALLVEEVLERPAPASVVLLALPPINAA